MKWPSVTACCFCILLSGCFTSDKQAVSLTEAFTSKQPFPVLSKQYPGFNMLSALQVQRAFVETRIKKDFIAGFKAEFRSSESQEIYSEPVTAVLFESGKYSTSSTVLSSELLNPKIEVEIGFVIKEPIIEPLTKVSELRGKIEAIVPVIEIPDISFTDMTSLTAEDMVAANAGSAGFIVGVERAWADLDLDDIAILLIHKGRIVSRGTGSDVPGGQAEACLRLINATIAKGYAIEPEHILITGALGKTLPASSGAYTADFRSLGKIYFQID